MIQIKTLLKLNTFEKFKTFCEQHNISLNYELGYRGGYFGVYANELNVYLGLNEGELPNKFGAYSNYLGGGLRGSICSSPCSRVQDDKKREWCATFAEICKTIYKELEDEVHLNDEEDENGETNWDAIGTNSSRKAGIVSAY